MMAFSKPLGRARHFQAGGSWGADWFRSLVASGIGSALRYLVGHAPRGTLGAASDHHHDR